MQRTPEPSLICRQLLFQLPGRFVGAAQAGPAALRALHPRHHRCSSHSRETGSRCLLALRSSRACAACGSSAALVHCRDAYAPSEGMRPAAPAGLDLAAVNAVKTCNCSVAVMAEALAEPLSAMRRFPRKPPIFSINGGGGTVLSAGLLQRLGRRRFEDCVHGHGRGGLGNCAGAPNRRPEHSQCGLGVQRCCLANACTGACAMPHDALSMMCTTGPVVTTLLQGATAC